MTNARVIQVVEVVSVEGEGTIQCPIRRVVRHFTFDGELLATSDPNVSAGGPTP